MTTPRVSGIHHITCIAGDPQRNLDFYAGTLGLRLVKRSVNQDDPATYHLFYADAEGRPGTDITFFPWPGGRRGRQGTGQATEVAFAVPPESLEAWQERLTEASVRIDGPTKRFGDDVLTFQDPDGLPLALVADPQAHQRPFTPWEPGPVPSDEQIRGFHAARVLERDLQATTEVATDVLGLELVDEEEGWQRYQGSDPNGGLLEVRANENAPRGTGGLGTVHHVAWNAGDQQAEGELRERAIQAGLSPTEFIDRFWFTSVYFREPGGVLFELATEEPGFTADEPLESLGERLVLPPWLEEDREKIEGILPELELPYPSSTDAERGSGA